MTLLESLAVLAVVASAAIAAPRVARFAQGSREQRFSTLQGIYVRITWRRLARITGLTYRDPTPRWQVLTSRRADPKTDQPRVIVPRISITPDPYGVIIRTRPLPGVPREAWEKAADDLAAWWRCTRVGITQDSRGRLVIRGVRRDPLITPTLWRPTSGSASSWHVGTDEFATPVRVPLAEVAGITVAGQPGSGKTSAINGLIASRASSPAVQFVVLDGKGGRDYAATKPRLSAFTDDHLGAANSLLTQLVILRRRRADLIRSFWDTGPTVDGPLIVVIIDEAHSFFAEYRGSDKETRELAALASENRRLVEDLAKKGRSAGLLTVLATQKPTGDSLPTSIRDVCAVNVSFAQSTQAASIAALGDSIKEWPSADPMQLQGRQYVGVCSMRLDSHPGFTRVRTPRVTDEQVTAACHQHADLARPLDDLMHGRRLRVVPDKEHAA